MDPFFTRGRYKGLCVYFLSQSFFDLPKRLIRDDSNVMFFSKRTLKDVENIFRDKAGFDMSHDEYKDLFREAWKVER